MKSVLACERTEATADQKLALGQFRNERGFTMIEMLMVVAILAIIAAMAIPSYMNYLRNYRVRNDANNIVGLTTIARMRAGANLSRAAVSCSSSICQIYTLQYTPSAVCTPLANWNLEPQQYTLSSTVQFGIPATATSGVMGQATTAPTQVYSGSGQTSLPYTIYFNSRGWPIDCNGNPISNYALYLQDQPGVFSVAVGIDPSGRGQVYVLSGSSYWVIKD